MFPITGLDSPVDRTIAEVLRVPQISVLVRSRSAPGRLPGGQVKDSEHVHGPRLRHGVVAATALLGAGVGEGAQTYLGASDETGSDSRASISSQV